MSAILSPAVAAQTNLSFYPVPDGTDDDPTGLNGGCMNMMGDKAICECNIIEACALHATDCLDGCTGAPAHKLVTFLGCFVEGEHPPAAGLVEEGKCMPQAKDKCLKSSGIDQQKHAACVAHKATQKAVMEEIWRKGRKVQTFPHCEVDGKLLPQEDEKTAERTLKKALCKAGARAAC